MNRHKYILALNADEALTLCFDKRFRKCADRHFASSLVEARQVGRRNLGVPNYRRIFKIVYGRASVSFHYMETIEPKKE